MNTRKLFIWLELKFCQEGQNLKSLFNLVATLDHFADFIGPLMCVIPLNILLCVPQIKKPTLWVNMKLQYKVYICFWKNKTNNHQ